MSQMPNSRPLPMLFLTFLLVLFGAAQAHADSAGQRRVVAPRPATPATARSASTDPDLLVLRGAVFDPVAERVDFSDLGFPLAQRGAHGIVQFKQGQEKARQGLSSSGVRFLSYLPHGAFQVQWTAAGRLAAERHPAVRWVGDYPPGLKAAPELWPGQELPDHTEIQVIAFKEADISAIAAALEAALPQLERQTFLPDTMQPRVRYRIALHERAHLVRLAIAIDAVAWVEPWYPPQFFNDSSVSPIQANMAQGTGATPIWDQDLLGTGQIVAVADSGLDRNQCWFDRYDNGVSLNTQITDADFPVPPATGAFFPQRKVVAYWVQPGASEYDNGGAFHGTHVSGSVAGDRGTAATPTAPNFLATDADGMAPNAQILFQDIGNDVSGALSGVSGDDRPMYRQAHAGGAYLHTNSWGADTNGAYIASDQEADEVLWQLEDLLILFAAGNAGPGVGTMGSPGNAKNVLTVGRVGHGNSTAVFSSSSRGPTDDGRTKPEIMAPGSSIRSARGNDNDMTASCPTAATLSGTSMSTPTVAGGAALMRQYFTDGFYPSGARNAADSRLPSGSLMKAVLLNGTGVTNQAMPNSNEGWGRIFLANNLYFGTGERRLRVWNKTHALGLEAGDTHTYTVVAPAGSVLRATLVWFDPPPTLGAGIQLINNLNLEVQDPGGVTFLGNDFAAGFSTTGGAADALNTTEQVRLNASAGTYTLRVIGAAVPGNGVLGSDRQGYALVVSYGDCGSGPASAPSGLSATDNGAAGIDVAYGAVAGTMVYNVYRQAGGCATDPATFDLVGTSASTTFTDTEALGGFDYAYRVRAVNGCAEGLLSACVNAVSTAPCGLFPDFDQASVNIANDLGTSACDLSLDWSAGASNCPFGPNVSYNVYRATAPGFAPSPGNLLIAGINGTVFTDQTAAPLTTYYYVVRAEDDTVGGAGPGGGNEKPGDRWVAATAVGANVPGTYNDGAEPVLMQLVDPWTVTATQASAGSLSYHNAEDGGIYPAGACAALTTLSIDLGIGGSPNLSYQARFDLESGWDGVVVEISTDGGASWADLPPDGGYPGDFSNTGASPINACAYAASQGAFSGSSGGAFQTFNHDLSAFSGQIVLRWRFSSDPGTEMEGFYLDEVMVTDASTPGACLAGGIFADGFESGDFNPWALAIP